MRLEVAAELKLHLFGQIPSVAEACRDAHPVVVDIVGSAVLFGNRRHEVTEIETCFYRVVFERSAESEFPAVFPFIFFDIFRSPAADFNIAVFIRIFNCVVPVNVVFRAFVIAVFVFRPLSPDRGETYAELKLVLEFVVNNGN